MTPRARQSLVVSLALLFQPSILAAHDGPPGEPTPEQLRDGIKAYGKFGARYEREPSPSPGSPIHRFYFGVELTDAALKGIPDLPFAFGLSIGGKVTDEGLKELEGLSNLTYLWISSFHYSDGGLKALRPLKNLSVLGLDGSKAGDAAMKEVAHLKNLATLSLHHHRAFPFRVTPAGLRELKGHPKLTTIHMPDYDVTNATLKALREAGLLHALFLCNTETYGKRPTCREDVTSVGFWRIPNVDNEGLKELKELTNLTHLGLPAQATDAGLREIKHFTKLTRLNLGMTQITDAGLKELASYDMKLTSLGLRETKVTGEGLKELKNFRSLTELSVSPLEVTDSALRSLREIDRLHILNFAHGKKSTRPSSARETVRLDFRGAQLTGAGLKELKPLTNLESLDLGYSKVADAGLNDLRDFQNLARLYLTRTAVSDAGLKDLRELKTLKVLDLRETKVTDAALTELREMHHLESLDVTGTKMSNAAIKELRQALPHCSISPSR